MARKRDIHPGFFKNEYIAELDPLARLLLIGMWTIADREGRLEDRPKKIKMEVLAGDDCNADELVATIAEKGFITRYEADGSKYIQIVHWDKYQHVHPKETPSVIPPMEENILGCTQGEPKNDLEKVQDEPFRAIPSFPSSTSLKDKILLVPAEADDEQNDRKVKYRFDKEQLALAERLKRRILENKPDAKVPDNLDQWADTIRLMMERDNRKYDRIIAVIDWCQKDSFWCHNILSANKLREKFDQLELKMNSGQGNKTTLTRREQDDLKRRRLAEEYDRRNGRQSDSTMQVKLPSILQY